MSATGPLFAVYTDDDELGSRTFTLEPCPVLALVTSEQEESEDVVGLVLEDWGYSDPRGTSNFAGYAVSEEDAKVRFQPTRIPLRK